MSTTHEEETLHINYGSRTKDQAKVRKVWVVALQKPVSTMF